MRQIPPPRMSVSSVSRRPGGRTESDWSAQRAASRRLEEHPHFRGRQRLVQCLVKDGTLSLVGWVPSYFLKALAQEALRDVPGVRQIQNRIRVTGRCGGLVQDSAAVSAPHR